MFWIKLIFWKLIGSVRIDRKCWVNQEIGEVLASPGYRADLSQYNWKGEHK